MFAIGLGVGIPFFRDQAGGVVPPPVGALSMSSLQTEAAVDLTALGSIDYALFTDVSGVPTQRKSGGGSRIGSVAGFGGSSLNPSTSVTVSYTDAVPGGSGSTNAAIYRVSIDNTTGLVAPVDAGLADWILRLGVGCYNGTIMADASLSDSSAPAIVGFNTGIVGTSGAQLDGWIDIRFKAASTAQTLTWRLWANGSTTPFSTAVTIQYAALRAA